MRLRYLALLLAATWGCGEPVAPDDRPELIVGVIGSDSAPAGATLPTKVHLTGRELVALGLLTAPSPCQKIRAFGVGQAFSVTWVIESRPRGTACFDVIETFAYRLATRLDPGEYRVSVVHRYPDTGWADVVALDTLIRVP